MQKKDTISSPESSRYLLIQRLITNFTEELLNYLFNGSVFIKIHAENQQILTHISTNDATLMLN